MKNLTNQFLIASAVLFTSTASFAQDKGLDIDVDLADDTPSLFSNPYFWIGVAAVIIIVTLITRIGKK